MPQRKASNKTTSSTGSTGPKVTPVTPGRNIRSGERPSYQAPKPPIKK